MFLVVGLGNPGIQYAKTRHNVGFSAVDFLCSFLSFPESRDKFNSLLSEKTIGGVRVFLQKPQTFMNASGKAVLGVVSFFKIPLENVLVIHDDIDLPPFQVKIKRGGGARGHNGIRSLDASIGRNYWRLLIGVGRPQLREDVSSYVLSDFFPSSVFADLDVVFSSIARNLTDILTSSNKQKLMGEVFPTKPE
jgi:PTH1 family peptidyl-tRNA hydrolase